MALAICLGAGMGWESRGCGSFLWGGRSLPFSTKTTALSEVEALVQQLNKIQQQQPIPCPSYPVPGPSLSCQGQALKREIAVSWNKMLCMQSR